MDGYEFQNCGLEEFQELKIKELYPQIYNELFSDKEDIVNSFNIPLSVIKDLVIIYAFYDYEDYSGSAEVIYYNPEDGIFYEVHGGHCSCYGLEGQWEPEIIGTYSTFIKYNLRYNK